MMTSKNMSKKMKTYIGTKIIQAEPCEKDYGPSETHGQPGYRIVYPDGGTSWSPKTAFEEACRETSAMSFGLAIEAMKKGSRVARTGWNGKEWTFAFLVQLDEDDTFIINARIDMKAADGSMVEGWLPSNVDMLADDWQIVE